MEERQLIIQGLVVDKQIAEKEITQLREENEKLKEQYKLGNSDDILEIAKLRECNEKLREIEKYIACRYSDMFPEWAYIGPLDAIDKITIEYDKLRTALEECKKYLNDYTAAFNLSEQPLMKKRRYNPDSKTRKKHNP